MKPRSTIKRKKKYDVEQPCRFCATATKVLQIGYKDLDILQKHITQYGKLFNRKRTGNCAKHQRQVTRAIKRARYLALFPYIGNTLKD